MTHDAVSLDVCTVGLVTRNAELDLDVLGTRLRHGGSVHPQWKDVKPSVVVARSSEHDALSSASIPNDW